MLCREFYSGWLEIGFHFAFPIVLTFVYIGFIRMLNCCVFPLSPWSSSLLAFGCLVKVFGFFGAFVLHGLFIPENI